MPYRQTPPSVGRIVHYVSYGTPGGEFTKQCRAAIVTEVSSAEEGLVGLAVLNPTGMHFHPSTPDFSDCPAGGTWHWPEVV